MSAPSAPSDRTAVVDLVRGVEGWLTDAQAETLHEAAGACPPGGTIVEIGSFRGRSTIVLASAAPEGCAVVAIDPHAGSDRGPQEIVGYAAEAGEDHDAFLANLGAAGVSARVRHVRSLSSEAHGDVDGSIDVLYIDGAHRYAPARADIVEWGARVADGGSMLIHDSFSSLGVTLAILRELVLGRRFRYVGRSRSLAVYQADLGPSASARASNAARQCAQLPWFAANLLLKAALAFGFGRLVRLLGRTPPEWPY